MANNGWHVACALARTNTSALSILLYFYKSQARAFHRLVIDEMRLVEMRLHELRQPHPNLRMIADIDRHLRLRESRLEQLWDSARGTLLNLQYDLAVMRRTFDGTYFAMANRSDHWYLLDQQYLTTLDHRLEMEENAWILQQGDHIGLGLPSFAQQPDEYEAPYGRQLQRERTALVQSYLHEIDALNMTDQATTWTLSNMGRIWQNHERRMVDYQRILDEILATSNTFVVFRAINGYWQRYINDFDQAAGQGVLPINPFDLNMYDD